MSLHPINKENSTPQLTMYEKYSQRVWKYFSTSTLFDIAHDVYSKTNVTFSDRLDF